MSYSASYHVAPASGGIISAAANVFDPLTTNFTTNNLANVKYGTTGTTSSYTGTQVMQNR